MGRTRLNTAKCIIKGLLAAIVFTVPVMLLIAAFAAYLQISDGLLTALNQLLKAGAIISGVWAAVGRGGERGFLTGMLVAMLYMIAGYGLYVLLGGNAFNVASMLGEILIGAAIGSITGAVLANMPAKRGKKHTHTA